MDINSLNLSDSGLPSSTASAASTADPGKAAPRHIMNGAAVANGRSKPAEKGKGSGGKPAEKKDPAQLKREKQLAGEAEVCTYRYTAP